MADYPTLANLFAAYFHQDWAMEHDSVEAVADYYRGAESDATVAAAREELAHLAAADLDEDALGATLRRLGCEYHPGAGSWHDFLGTIAQRLSR